MDMVLKNRDRAVTALNAFYQAGYSSLRGTGSERQVDGFFVSDCGVLFAREDGSETERFVAIASVIEAIHRESFENAVQLASSIAYGTFSYHDRLEFQGIDKTPIHGGAYLSAYADSVQSAPRLFPSESRLVKANLPADVADFLSGGTIPLAWKFREEPDHFYFEWMRHAPRDRVRPMSQVVMG
jgi:hypothetical protein